MHPDPNRPEDESLEAEAPDLPRSREGIALGLVLGAAVAVAIALAVALAFRVQVGLPPDEVASAGGERLLAALTATAIGVLAWLAIWLTLRPALAALREAATFALQIDGSGRTLELASRVREVRELAQALNAASLRLAGEQRRAENTERELLALTRNIPGVVYRCRADGSWTMEHLSPDFERLTGFAAEEIVGDRVFSYRDIMHPEDIDKASPLVTSAIAQRRPFAAQYRLRARDGSTRWVLDKGQAVFDEQGAPLYLTGVIINDTARRIAMSELARSEVKHRRLLENLSEVVWQTDLDSRITFVNRAWRQVTGTPPEQVVRSRLLDHIEPVDRPDAELAWRRLLSGEDASVQWKARVLTTSGEPRWAEFTASIIAGSDGGPSGVTGLLADIHERTLLDARIREGEERLQLAVQSTRLGLWDWNIATGRVHFNEYCSSMLGYAPGELTPGLATLRALVHPEDRSAVDAALAAHLSRADTPYAVECRMRAKSGQWRWILSQGQVVSRDAAGEALRMIGTHLDITERHETEAHARQLAQVVDQASDAIMVTDLQGRLIAWNRGAELLYGYPATEALGGDPRELLGVDAGTVSGERLAVAGRRRRDGARVDVEESASPLFDATGHLIGEIRVARDISERLRVQAELQRAKDEAEAADRAKGEFLANVSHEIRTPMNGIIGMTELALDTPLDPEQRDYLQTVRRSAENLLQVINDILDYSKIDAGRLSIETVGFSLREVLSDAVSAVAADAREKSLRLIVDVEPGLPDALLGDPLRIRQVLLNLLGNAVKFTERGEVVLGAERTADTSGIGLRLSVRDTGIGIAPDKQRLIFEPFSQADASTTRRYGGTGLGLSITRQLAALMSGRLSVQSEPGRGSTFAFSLVLQPDPAAPPASAARVPGGAQRLRVLLIDPTDSSRRALVHLLEHWGAQVEACALIEQASAVAADAAVLETRYDLAVVHVAETDPAALARLAAWLGTRIERVAIAAPSAPRGSDPVWSVLGARAVLAPPVTGSDLYNAIADLIAPRGEPSTAAARPAPQSDDPAKATHPSLVVLVAEDNVVNQRLAVALLEKAGHRVTVVGDGAAAVQSWAAGAFDLILMDLQMPHLGGLEATAMIREAERARGPGHARTPIVALTAHAMSGDEQRCLDAGMDGYLSKPLRRDRLEAVLALVLAQPGPGEARAGTPAPARAAERTVPPVDLAALLATLGDDRAAFSELREVFLESLPQLRETLEAAHRAEDAPALARAAHALRGALATFHAHPGAEALARLEAAAEREDRAAIGPLVAEVDREVTAVLAALQPDAQPVTVV